jgi:hypothetical protein
VAASAMVPDDVAVGAVRISASGWEGAVLEGLEVSALKPASAHSTCLLSAFGRRLVARCRLHCSIATVFDTESISCVRQASAVQLHW